MGGKRDAMAKAADRNPELFATVRGRRGEVKRDRRAVRGAAAAAIIDGTAHRPASASPFRHSPSPLSRRTR